MKMDKVERYDEEKTSSELIRIGSANREVARNREILLEVGNVAYVGKFKIDYNEEENNITLDSKDVCIKVKTTKLLTEEIVGKVDRFIYAWAFHNRHRYINLIEIIEAMGYCVEDFEVIKKDRWENVIEIPYYTEVKGHIGLSSVWEMFKASETGEALMYMKGFYKEPTMKMRLVYGSEVQYKALVEGRSNVGYFESIRTGDPLLEEEAVKKAYPKYREQPKRYLYKYVTYTGEEFVVDFYIDK